MIFVESGDAVIHAELIGDPEEQPVLVFSNALGTDFRIWDRVAARFAEDYALLLYDERGHGLSGLGTRPVTIDRHVDDLLALVDDLGIERFGLVGLSLGGMIAQRLAVRAPERLAALVLCATAPRIGDAAGWDGRITAVERDGLDPIGDAAMERWFTAAYRAEGAARPADLARHADAAVGEGLCGFLRGHPAMPTSTADAARIDVPTLVVAGSADLSTPPALVRALAGRIPGARFEVIDGAAHLPCIERPEALADLIADHLDQVTDDDDARDFCVPSGPA